MIGKTKDVSEHNFVSADILSFVGQKLQTDDV